MVYYTTQEPPLPQPHTVCIYCTFSLGRGGEVREKVEGQPYTRIVTRPWGQQFTSWVENTINECMYLQTIKSVKHNAAKSVHRSILKKSQHFGFGVFIVHSSMLSPHMNTNLSPAAYLSTMEEPGGQCTVFIAWIATEPAIKCVFMGGGGVPPPFCPPPPPPGLFQKNNEKTTRQF
jgi:hypothetical protein